jgi:hypothetical protein
MNDLSSMYEKVISKMNMPNVRFDIDLYTLYDYISVYLVLCFEQNKNYSPSNINTMRLKHTTSKIDRQKIAFMFFEIDKLRNRKINLEGAISIAGFSDTEKQLWNRKLKIIGLIMETISLYISEKQQKHDEDEEDDDTSSENSDDEDDLQNFKDKQNNSNGHQK